MKDFNARKAAGKYEFDFLSLTSSATNGLHNTDLSTNAEANNKSEGLDTFCQ